jgi:hypothetical protein
VEVQFHNSLPQQYTVSGQLLPHGNSSHYSLRAQSPSGHYEEDQIISPLPGIESQILSHAVLSAVTILLELSRLLADTCTSYNAGRRNCILSLFLERVHARPAL